VDSFSHKFLAIHPGQSIKGFDVVEVMNRIKTEVRTLPKLIQVANGSEFYSIEEMITTHSGPTVQ
jgi:putative transposase